MLRWDVCLFDCLFFFGRFWPPYTKKKWAIIAKLILGDSQWLGRIIRCLNYAINMYRGGVYQNAGFQSGWCESLINRSFSQFLFRPSGLKFVRLWYLKNSGHGACNLKDILLSQRGSGIVGRQIGTNIWLLLRLGFTRSYTRLKASRYEEAGCRQG